MAAHIHWAGKDDVPEIVELVNRAFQTDQDILAGERTSVDEVRELVETRAVLIAIEAQTIVGVVEVQTSGISGYFGMLAVKPEFQRSGFGRALIEAAENYCREQGCTEIELTTPRVRPELIRRYAHCGYTITGIEPQPSDVQFRKRLNFVRMAKRL